MVVDNAELELARIEVILKTYDSRGQVIKEQVELYFPKETTKQIGFKQTKK